MSTRSTFKSLSSVLFLTCGVLAAGCGEITGPESPAETPKVPEQNIRRIMGKPDLVISEMREVVTLDRYRRVQRWVDVTVENRGQVTALGLYLGIKVNLHKDMPLDYRYDAVATGTRYVNLDPGRSLTMRLYVGSSCFPSLGHWTAIVDPDGVISELDEKNVNNSLWSTLHVCP